MLQIQNVLFSPLIIKDNYMVTQTMIILIAQANWARYSEQLEAMH